MFTLREASPFPILEFERGNPTEHSTQSQHLGEYKQPGFNPLNPAGSLLHLNNFKRFYGNEPR
jgi:hypothetical protein